jgi:hypothetical protein
MTTNKITICWFGVYRPNFSRNRIYIKGLRMQGVDIIECRDTSRGPLKYLKLFVNHWKIRKAYDFLVVGYPGHSVVWFAKLISKKPVVFDALCTMEEGVILSRKQNGFLGLNRLYIKFIDRLAVQCADLIFVETEAQRQFFENKFGESAKYRVIYIGADDAACHPDSAVDKKKHFYGSI